MDANYINEINKFSDRPLLQERVKRFFVEAEYLLDDLKDWHMGFRPLEVIVNNELYPRRNDELEDTACIVSLKRAISEIAESCNVGVEMSSYPFFISSTVI